MNWILSSGRIVFVIGAGILMAFAHPFRYYDTAWDSNWWTTALASLGLMIFMAVSAQSQRFWIRFLYGWIGGLAFFCTALFWLVLALRIYGEIPRPLAILTLLILSSYLAIYSGLWAGIAGSQSLRCKSHFVCCFLWAACWAGLEAIREILFTGFPWGEIGFGLGFSDFLRSSASIWGVHGLTFLWVFLVAALLHLNEWNRERSERRAFGFAAALLSLILIVSAFLSPRSEGTVKLKVGLVQPNISQELKWDPHRAEDHLNDLIGLTESLSQSDPDLIVWPETAFPYLVSSNQSQLPIHSPRPLLVGAVVREGEANRNSALLITNDKVVSRFDKRHLVPFGEYVPFKNWIPFGKLVANAGDFLEGSFDQKPMDLPNGGPKIGALICYEDIFSASSVSLAKLGTELLVNLTNDAWYGKTSAQAQHSMMAALQVAQTKIPMVRATNDGLSAVITPHKIVHVEAFTKTAHVEEVEVPIRPKPTFFVWTYPLMIWIWWILFVIGLLWKDHPRTRKIFFRT